jgi:hypothetical protein
MIFSIIAMPNTLVNRIKLYFLVPLGRMVLIVHSSHIFRNKIHLFVMFSQELNVLSNTT